LAAFVFSGGFMDLPFDQWTSCEMYGHLFVQDAEGSRFFHCSDCGEEAEDVSLADGAAALPMPAVEK